MASGFAEAGHEVWVTDVDAVSLRDVPEGWHARQVDVSDEDAMRTIFDEIAEAGGLEVLCANAGIAGPTAPVDAISLKDWKACLSVNLDGTFIAVKLAAPLMKAAGEGAIVITSSTAGQHGFPNRAPYCAAKWAVIGLMKTLAMELGMHGVRANAICPGPVEGPRMEKVLLREAESKGMTRDALYAAYGAGMSMGRFVEPEDIARMAVFLASDAAQLVSGQVIAVDGHTVNPDPKAG